MRDFSLHGSAPDNCDTALLIIDAISRFDFPGGERLLLPARRAASQIARLKDALEQVGVPTIYVNDNHGKWRSDFRSIIENAGGLGSKGHDIYQALYPRGEDYVVLKAKHSAFYGTTLEEILKNIGVSNLILTGFTTNQCVLTSAHEAYIRDFNLTIPEDCVAAIDPHAHEWALRHFEDVLSADTRTAEELIESLPHYGSVFRSLG